MIFKIKNSYKIDNVIYDKRIINRLRKVFLTKVAVKAENNFYKKLLDKIK